jgi:hypothetical protein
MPIENDGQSVDGKPQHQTSVDPPLQSARHEYIPTNPAAQTAAQNESIAIQLEQDLRVGERWLIGIGIATLLINSIIALIYWGQLKEMRMATEAATQASKTAKETLSEMKNGSGAQDTHTLAQQAVTQAIQTTNLAASTKDQAAQTQRLADAAFAQNAAANQVAAQSQKSVDISSKSFAAAVHSDRAWIGMGQFKLNRFEVGKKVEAEFILLNSGRTPALTVFQGGESQTLSLSLPLNVLESAISAQQSHLQMAPSQVIAPNGFDHLFPVPNRTLSQEEFDLVKNGAAAYYMVGRIDFVDVSNRKQWMKYCARIQYLSGTPQLLYCPVGNDMSYQEEK